MVGPTTASFVGRGGTTLCVVTEASTLPNHLPRALALLGRTLPPFRTSQGHRAGDAAVPASAAREARGLIDHVLAILPPDDVDPVLPASKLTDVAGAVYAAYEIAEEMLKLVAPEDEEADSGRVRRLAENAESTRPMQRWISDG